MSLVGALPSVLPVTVGLLVLRVAHFFQPVDALAIELLQDRDVRHGRRGGRTMPMLLAGRTRDYITRPDHLDRPSPALDQTTSGRDDERLAERMGVPGSAGAGLEGDADAETARRLLRLKQRIDPHGACERLGRPFGGRL